MKAWIMSGTWSSGYLKRSAPPRGIFVESANFEIAPHEEKGARKLAVAGAVLFACFHDLFRVFPAVPASVALLSRVSVPSKRHVAPKVAPKDNPGPTNLGTP